MNCILLTGAGFTYNWGGWLAKEIEGDLLGRVSAEPLLRRRLQSTPNFEVALEQLQSERVTGTSDSIHQLGTLQTAVAASFRHMNLALADRPFEFSNDVAYSVAKYLSRFDAIFTLNQDLLFELHYDPSLIGARRWHGIQFPGVSPLGLRAIDRRAIVDQRRHVNPIAEVGAGAQPIYKLHGSADWVDASGEIFVVGGGKESYIRSNPTLASYFDRFRQALLVPGTRLMIIGYGFADDHVNRLLTECSQSNPTLGVFYIHPDGRDSVHRKTAVPVVIPIPTLLTDLPCIGESRRPISATFGGDALELGKLMRFFG